MLKQEYEVIYCELMLAFIFFQKSAQYLQKELPKRVARRVKDLQGLPYIVAINPLMQEVVSSTTYLIRPVLLCCVMH